MPAEDNLSEYSDPILFDNENADLGPSWPFYLALARRASGPVLDLGCGTGRLTIPLAQQGIDITGLDPVPAMLARARGKAGDLPISWIAADARAFCLDRRFALIMAVGSVFPHLLELADQEAMLSRVREHLAPGGVFAFDTIFPQLGQIQTDETEREWFSYSSDDGREVRVSGTQHYDPLRQVRVETAYRRWREAGGQEIVQVAPLALRLTFPQEMEALLHYNGLAVLERYGGYDSGPLTADSQIMVYVCRVA